MNFLKKIIFSVNINMVSDLQILVNINFFQLCMTFIYASFDCNSPIDVRGFFLDISKAFERVWHNGPIYRIKFCGINGMFLKLIIMFLRNSK